jgi:hypothetical protein
MPDEKVLGAKSREVVLAGKLLSRRRDRTWAGPGIDNSSMICGARIKQDQVEFEIQFGHDGDGAAAGVERFHLLSAASRRGSSSAPGMSARTTSPTEQESLRLFIRRKIQNGRLSRAGIRRIWSSPSDGQTCDACDVTLAKEQLLIEGITLGLGRRRFQFHVRCFQIWDHERRTA